jgi:hypothetical protein
MKSIQTTKQDKDVEFKIVAVKIDPRAVSISAMGFVFNKV